MRISFFRAPARALFLGLLLLLGVNDAHAVIFTVTSNANSGAGTLRQAILDANANATVDEIRFNLASGQRVITPLTSLPVMTTPIDVNGLSQPGYAGTPLVGLNGATAGGIGLRCTSSFCSVRGLAVYAFDTGISMEGAFFSVKSNYIGLTAAGTSRAGNTGTGLSFSGDFGTVGGTQSADRNVISANGGSGIVIGTDANDALIFGNFIGTDAAGVLDIGNGDYGIRSLGEDNQIGTNLVGGGNLIVGNERGISLESDGTVGTSVRGNVIGLNAAGTAEIGNDGVGIEISSDNNVIGGTVAGDRNIVSGNGSAGITVSADASGNLIQGNYIGTNVGGTAAIGNTGVGISIAGNDNQVGGATASGANLVSGNSGGIDVGGNDNAILGNLVGTNAAGTAAIANTGGGVTLYGSFNDLGGTAAGEGNLMSGNLGNGVAIIGGTGNRVRGNRVGTNKAGAAAIANGSYAVRVIDSTENEIGGSDAGAGNVLSGNARGVVFESDAPSNLLQGNIIGLAADGQFPLGNQGNGVELNSGDNVVGGDTAGAGNVIASNQYYGVVLQGPASTGNVVQGNRIGVASDAATLRGNYYNVLFYGASGNTIGGTGPGEGNVIAGSVNAGVYLWFGTHNEILGNSFFSNGGLGIDFEPQGINANDKLDADSGPNEKQNMPVLTSAIEDAAQLAIQGKLHSGPSSTYRIEFFSSPACDPSGFGEGKTFLGSTNVMTDADGNATIATNVPFAGADLVLTATATSADGDTSEFSPCATINEGENPGALQFSQDQFLGYEEQGFVTITVVRTGGATGQVSVHYETVEDTATSPEDFGDVSGTLTFADGEIVKFFHVPLVLDGPDGGGQNINLELSDPTGGATLGAENEAHVMLFDYSTDFPGVYISNATVYEGDDGTTTADFLVTVTPTDHQVTFDVCTTAGNAAAGSDYESTQQSMVFAAGDAPKTVSVTIHGDMDVEGTETFFLLTCGQLLPGGYAGNIGHGFILDDDGPILAPAECGNGLVQVPEGCDDNDILFAAGDYCSADCARYSCGVPTNIATAVPKAGDALFVLKAAVAGTNCDLEVCDVNESGTVTATDALLILKKAVGQSVTLDCPQ